MKRQLISYLLAAAASAAALIACTREPETQPEVYDQETEYEVVLTASLAPDTRGVSVTSDAVTATWSADDKVALVYNNKILTALEVTGISGNSAQLSGKVYGAYPTNTAMTLYYGGVNADFTAISYDYTGQDGTAASAAARAYLQADVKIAKQENKKLTLGDATTGGAITLAHQQAYYQLNFQYGPDQLKVRKVEVTLKAPAESKIVKSRTLTDNGFTSTYYTGTSENHYTVEAPEATYPAGLSTVYFVFSDVSTPPTADGFLYDFTITDVNGQSYSAEWKLEDGVAVKLELDKRGPAVNGTYRSGTWVLDRQTPVPTAPQAQSVVYDAQPHELVTPGAVPYGEGLAEGAVLMYYYAKSTRPVNEAMTAADTLALAPNANSTWQTEVPVETEPGHYCVWYKVVGGRYFNDVPPTPVVSIDPAPSHATLNAALIDKRSLSVTAPTGIANLKYTGTSQSLVNAGTIKDATSEEFDPGLVMQYCVDSVAIGGTAPSALPANPVWSTDVPSFTNAYDYYIWYKVEGSDHYYGLDVTMLSAPVTIQTTDAVIANPEPIVNLIYNGDYQQLVLPADASDGCKVYYHIHESDVDRSVIEAMTQSDNWSTDVPMRKNAGTYYVWTKVVDESGGNNYSGITGISAAAVVTQIAKADISTSVPTLVSWTYDAEQRNLLSDSLRVTFSSTSANTDALKEEVPAVLYFKVTNTTIWADWTAYNPSAPVLPYATDAKSYQVSFKVDGGRNFKSIDATVIGTAVVSKADLMYDPAPAAVTETLTYTGQPQTLVTAGEAKYATSHPTKPGADAVGPVVKYMVADSKPSKNASGWLTTPPAATNAQATYKVWYYVDGGANFNDIDVCSTPVEKEIIKATLMYNPAPAAVTETLVYTGQPQTLITAGEVKYATGHPTMAGQAADGPVLYYMISDSQPSITTEGWQTTLPTATNANSYNVWYKVDGGDNFNNIDVCATPIEKGIGKATLTATADNKQRDYNTANPTFTVTVTGFVNGETASTAAGYVAPTATCSATQSSAAGTYPITVSGGSANNYVFNYVNGTLTINQSVLSITIPVDGQSTSVTINYYAGDSWYTALQRNPVQNVGYLMHQVVYNNDYYLRYSNGSEVNEDALIDPNYSYVFKK